MSSNGMVKIVCAWVVVCATAVTLFAVVLTVHHRPASMPVAAPPHPDDYPTTDPTTIKAEPVSEDTTSMPADLTKPARPMPARFPKDTHLPTNSEADVCIAFDPDAFSAEKDLIRIVDTRVWFESDEHANGDEDDHLIHRAMSTPFMRLIELVCQHKGRLKVHDAYRTRGPHCELSLHKEGRAVDLTCEEFSLSHLAKLAWAAGFDWVFYETSGGDHVHCSVRRPRHNNTRKP